MYARLQPSFDAFLSLNGKIYHMRRSGFAAGSMRNCAWVAVIAYKHVIAVGGSAILRGVQKYAA